MRTKDEIRKRLATRERKALKIDADTAEVSWSYCYLPDSYDVDEGGCILLAVRQATSGSAFTICDCELHLMEVAPSDDGSCGRGTLGMRGIGT